MTLPDERLKAVNYAREFLYSLLDPKRTPGVPKHIRKNAAVALRHFPAEHEMDNAADMTSGIFGPYKDNFQMKLPIKKEKKNGV